MYGGSEYSERHSLTMRLCYRCTHHFHTHFSQVEASRSFAKMKLLSKKNSADKEKEIKNDGESLIYGLFSAFSFTRAC